MHRITRHSIGPATCSTTKDGATFQDSDFQATFGQSDLIEPRLTTSSTPTQHLQLHLLSHVWIVEHLNLLQKQQQLLQ